MFSENADAIKLQLSAVVMRDAHRYPQFGQLFEDLPYPVELSDGFLHGCRRTAVL